MLSTIPSPDSVVILIRNRKKKQILSRVFLFQCSSRFRRRLFISDTVRRANRHGEMVRGRFEKIGRIKLPARLTGSREGQRRFPQSESSAL